MYSTIDAALESALPLNTGALATLTTLMVLLGKATILLAVAMVITRIMQRTSAVSRHLVWFASLAAILVIPIVIAVSPVRFPILPSGWASTIAPAVPTTATTTTPATTPTTGSQSIAFAATNAHNGNPTPLSNAVQEGSIAQALVNPNSDAVVVGDNSRPTKTALAATAPSFGIMLLALWTTIAVAFVLWLLFGMWSVRRIVRNAASVTGDTWDTLRFEIADRLSLKEAPVLVLSDKVAMPFACGFRTPTIVLPRNSNDWSTEQRTAVLLHEMAHIRRRDIVGHTVGRFACALYWFHPLVWTAAKRLRAESERACDDLALLCGARASDYAEHLLDIVAHVKANTTPPVAMAMATRKEFEGRMLAILDPALTRVAPSRRQSVSLVASVVGLAMVLGVAVPATSATVPKAGPPASTVQLLAGSRDTIDIAPGSVSMPEAAEAPERIADRMLPLAVPYPPAPIDNRLLPVPDKDDIISIAMSAIEMGLKESGRALSNLDLNTEIVRAMSADTSERAALLTKILRTETQSELRRVAAWGLRTYANDASVTEALANAVGHDTSAAVREMAAWSLRSGHHGTVGANALIAAVRNDKSDTVRFTAVWSLASMRNNADTSTVNALRFALKSRNSGVREMATWALGTIDLRTAPLGLVTMLKDADSDVRYSAAWTVYQIGDAAAVNALDQALRNEKVETVQLAQVRALTSLGESAVSVLKRLIEDPNPEIKSMAINALAGGHGIGPWPRPRPMPRPFP